MSDSSKDERRGGASDKPTASGSGQAGAGSPKDVSAKDPKADKEPKEPGKGTAKDTVAKDTAAKDTVKDSAKETDQPTGAKAATTAGDDKTAGKSAAETAAAGPARDKPGPDKAARAGSEAGPEKDKDRDKTTGARESTAALAAKFDQAPSGAGTSSAATQAGARRAGAGPSSSAAARPTAGAAQRGGGGRLLAGFLFGAAVVVLVAAGTIYSRAQWEPYAAEWFGVPRPDTQLSSELAALSQRIAGLAQEQNQLASQISDQASRVSELAGRSASQQDIADLDQRLSELDGQVERLAAAAASGAADAELARQLADRLAGLEQRAADSEALQAETEALQQEVASLESRVAKLADAGPAGQATLMLGVLQLRDALRGSAPFADELTMLDGLLADDPALAATLDGLAPHAERGIPTVEQLRARFPPVARRVVAAGAGEGDEGWLGGIKRQLADLATVRPVGNIEGGDAAAVVARAEQELAAGDLNGALAELDALSGPAAEAAADWMTAARARLEAHQALSALGARLGEQLKPAGG